MGVIFELNELSVFGIFWDIVLENFLYDIIILEFVMENIIYYMYYLILNEEGKIFFINEFYLVVEVFSLG